MKKATWLSALCLFGVLFCAAPVGHAASPPISYTPLQQQDIQQAKEKTKQAIANWDNGAGTRSDASVTGAIGAPGEILVTLDGTSSGSSAWAGGHAAVVSDVAGYTVESFGNKGDLNGVRHWVNDWSTRYTKVKGLRVQGATGADYSYAASYNRQQIGKPYNYNFFNVTTTSSFYCSQLVWRAYYNRGYDLNDGLAVWPVDLIESPLTYEFYSQG
ncbi:YiiX/YebB-like N1pC/P60 family cysteine hydrolase [Laceyella putida]|uniref:YiiX/YebB-like N1pC/P60 family cysteine hydrolase n=1 Tax=Laceyella putida TaxID=110101 RepID=A0ABW2RJD0_9BACL